MTAPAPLPHALPDPQDEAFLEVAVAGGACCLITGNARHYPPGRRLGIRALSPREFLDMYRRELRPRS